MYNPSLDARHLVNSGATVSFASIWHLLLYVDPTLNVLLIYLLFVFRE